MDIGALHVTVHRVAKSWTQLKWFSPHTHSSLPPWAMSPSKQAPCSWRARSGPSNLQGWSCWPVMLAPEQSSHGGPQAHKDPAFAPRCCLPLLSPPYPLSLHLPETLLFIYLNTIFLPGPSCAASDLLCPFPRKGLTLLSWLALSLFYLSSMFSHAL